jgi:hypothetical protein
VTGTGIAAERQSDGPVQRAQSVGLTRPRSGYVGQRFGEGPARTRRRGAPEAANPDEQ